MARWQITEPVYFRTIPPLEWEYKEINEQTGQLTRIVLPVPTYIDPKSGRNVLCHPGKGQPLDIAFEGPPTPSMVPLDEEAQAISDAERPRWDHPIDSLPAQGQSMAPETKHMMEEFAKTIGEAVKPLPIISRDEFDALRAELAVVMKKNAELEKAAVRRP